MTIRTEDDAKFLTIPKGRRNVGSTSSADTLIGEGLVTRLCLVDGGGNGRIFLLFFLLTQIEVGSKQKSVAHFKGV